MTTHTQQIEDLKKIHHELLKIQPVDFEEIYDLFGTLLTTLIRHKEQS